MRSIIYATVKTQIAIVLTTSMISYFAKNLGPDHFSAIDQILRYLVDRQDRGIIFGGESELCLIGYLDSEKARDHTDKKLISRFVLTLNGEPISYGSKKQVVIALSFTKAKYVAFGLEVQEAT